MINLKNMSGKETEWAEGGNLGTVVEGCEHWWWN